MQYQGIIGNFPTGPTGLCHESSAAIGEAAQWLVNNLDNCERPIIPALRWRFGLTVCEALCALAEARQLTDRERAL